MIRVIVLTLLLSVSAFATTYYVHPAGNNTTGLSWANAWTVLDSVNVNVVQSDTVYFGTGLWRGHLKLMQGTFENHTLYACSAFADTNASGTYHFAKIYGSVNYKDSSWTNVAGNIYKTHFALTNICGDTVAGGLCCQGDSILILQSEYGNLDAAGEFFVSVNDTLYVYLYDTGSGYNPSSYDIETAKQPVIITWESGGSGECGGAGRPALDWISDSASYVTLYGLEFKYGTLHVIGMYEEDKPDSLFIEHCKVSHATSMYSTSSNLNPALIYSNYSTSRADYLHVTACSLGYGINYTGGNHGNGVQWYSATNVLIDSCTFYGDFTAYAVYMKCAYGTNNSVNNVVRYNTFNQTSGAGIHLYFDTSNDSIYGNTFISNGSSGAIKVSCTTVGDASKDIFIFNNTIYDSRGLQRYKNTPAEICGDGKMTMENVQFKYNILHATQDAIDGGGVYFSEYSLYGQRIV